MSNIQATSDKVGVDSLDVEKHGSSDAVDATESDSQSVQGKLSWKTKLIALGIEERGILPVPVEERTSDRFVNIFSIWFTMSITPLACVCDYPTLYTLLIRLLVVLLQESSGRSFLDSVLEMHRSSLYFSAFSAPFQLRTFQLWDQRLDSGS